MKTVFKILVSTSGTKENAIQPGEGHLRLLGEEHHTGARRTARATIPFPVDKRHTNGVLREGPGSG